MKKQLIALFAVFVFLTAAAPVVTAQDDVDVATEETVEDVGMGDTGILPTNPFYFLKEWGRGIRRALILDPVDRAQYELDVTTEKANELRRVGEIDSSNVGGLERASRNYEKSMERLRERLEHVQENSNNPNVERLLNNVTERVSEHEKRFENLADKLEGIRKLTDRIKGVGENLDRAVGLPLRNIEGLDGAKERALEVIQERRGDLEQIDFSQVPSQIDNIRKKFEIKLGDTDEFRSRLRIEDKDGEERSRLRIEDENGRREFRARIDNDDKEQEFRTRIEDRANNEVDPDRDPSNPFPRDDAI